MVITDKYIFFWNGIYSQWYESPIFIDGINFNCCEQYMMYRKALLFYDNDTAERIMLTSHPRDQKELGRSVKNFDKNQWDSVNFQIVYKANYYKFTQHENLKKELLSTGNKIIVEASPFDKIWGIGLGEKDEKCNDPVEWKGQNLLGWAITLVRQELI